MDFTYIFQRLMKEHGVTAYKMAKDTGLSTTLITNWKNGDMRPGIDNLQKIADYFGVTPNYLMGVDRENNDDFKFALLGGEDGVTPEQYEEVKQFVKWLRERDKGKK